MKLRFSGAQAVKKSCSLPNSNPLWQRELKRVSSNSKPETFQHIEISAELKRFLRKKRKINPFLKVNTMARLIVTALSEDTVAAPGNRLSNYIVVSVTDTDGNPVKGLTVENFKVDPMIGAPGGALVNVSGFFEGRLPGFYYLNVVPAHMETWKLGVYIFAVVVERGKDKGQTLASVLMD